MNYNRVRGRYGGGVRVADGYYLGRKYLKPDQQELLKPVSYTHLTLPTNSLV